MGKYLNERFESIANILLKKGLIQYVNEEVIRTDVDNELIHIYTIGGKNYRVHEAVLAIGHQPIELDDQLNSWQSRILNLDDVILFTQPYPISRILRSNVRNQHNVIIRGFGLAMIDLLRGLSEGLNGKFKINDKNTREMIYIESGKEPKNIIPFSLDGLPMTPKPLNKKIDSKYLPSNQELKEYSDYVTRSITSNSTLTSPKFLMEAIAPIVLRVFKKLRHDNIGISITNEELHSLIINWLNDGEYEHELILSKRISATEMMTKFVGMATGHEMVSIDFCIGHVWRHCQPTLYKLLSFAPLTDKIISEIVALDERLKRYSYGPPVDSIQQILALVKAGKVTLDLVNNPKITLKEDGWHMVKGDNSIKASVMINSVLDAPEILKVVSPLPHGLITKSVVEPIHDALGICTEKDATIVKTGNDIEPPLAVLGRLAKGTLIGVDAIAECFSNRSEYWARGVLSRSNK